MAPNVVTFIGFIIMFCSYTFMLMYDTSLTQTIPNFLFFLAGIEILIYQTLDAVDGK